MADGSRLKSSIEKSSAEGSNASFDVSKLNIEAIASSSTVTSDAMSNPSRSGFSSSSRKVRPENTFVAGSSSCMRTISVPAALVTM